LDTEAPRVALFKRVAAALSVLRLTVSEAVEVFSSALNLSFQRKNHAGQHGAEIVHKFLLPTGRVLAKNPLAKPWQHLNQPRKNRKTHT
jgi:hypothetical protein